MTSAGIDTPTSQAAQAACGRRPVRAVARCDGGHLARSRDRCSPRRRSRRRRVGRAGLARRARSPAVGGHRGHALAGRSSPARAGRSASASERSRHIRTSGSTRAPSGRSAPPGTSWRPSTTRRPGSARLRRRSRETRNGSATGSPNAASRGRARYPHETVDASLGARRLRRRRRDRRAVARRRGRRRHRPGRQARAEERYGDSAAGRLKAAMVYERARAWHLLGTLPLPGRGELATPVKGIVGGCGYFGCPRPGHLHNGVDFLAPAGAPIRAVDEGRVALIQSIGQSGGYGNFVCIQHRPHLSSCYAHMSAVAEHVEIGAVVRRGRSSVSSARRAPARPRTCISRSGAARRAARPVRSTRSRCSPARYRERRCRRWRESCPHPLARLLPARRRHRLRRPQRSPRRLRRHPAKSPRTAPNPTWIRRL